MSSRTLNATVNITRIFVCSDGTLKDISLSTKLGEIELGEVYRFAQENYWEGETLDQRIEEARTKVDANHASPKEYTLLELERQGRLSLLNGVERWAIRISPSRAVGVAVNPDTESLEAMVVDLHQFTPIYSEQVTTLERLQQLTSPIDRDLICSINVEQASCLHRSESLCHNLSKTQQGPLGHNTERSFKAN